MPTSSFFARYSAYLQAAPLTLVLLVFLVGPLIVILIFSVFKFTGFIWEPGFVIENYERIFTDRFPVTIKNYVQTIKITAITWAITLFIGFTLSYFFVFDLIRFKIKIFFFLLVIVPFWTSGVVRMVSWLPILGREGLVNKVVVGVGLSEQPWDFLFLSEFSVIVGYVHVFSLFMVAPLFNVMARIDPSLFEAARDQGAKGWQILLYIIIPMTKPGIAIGTIFVVALVASDSTISRILSGGKMGTISTTISNQYQHFQYPFAAANGIIFLIVLLLFVGGLMRVVNVREQL
ncbi:MAG: ABC transporter permease [Proteobacteria bacterium]|nr:ABC transporter permease [Pseudomonadota bacterium]